MKRDIILWQRRKSASFFKGIDVHVRQQIAASCGLDCMFAQTDSKRTEMLLQAHPSLELSETNA